MHIYVKAFSNCNHRGVILIFSGKKIIHACAIVM